MRGPLAAHGDRAACALVTLGFAAHQHLDPAGKYGNFRILPRDCIGHIIKCTGQVGDLFFEAFHSAFVARARHRVKRARVRRVRARYFSQEKALAGGRCLG